MKPKLKYGRKRECPCPRNKMQYCPVLDSNGEETDSGKCWSTACGQQFFTSASTGKSRYSKHGQKVVPKSNSCEEASEQTSKCAVVERRTHTYNDVAGNPYTRTLIVKYADGSKDAWQQRWEDVQWKKGLGGREPIIYNALEVIERIALGGTIVVCEGEKDCEAASVIGITATTCPMGAGKWTDSMSAIFTDARVVIIPDQDPAGWDHAHKVHQSLLKAGVAAVGILDLRELMPDLPDKGDLSDYLDRGGDPEALRQAIEAACGNRDVADEISYVTQLPTIPWNTLPDPLKVLVQPVEDERLRTSLLMAAITTIGAVLPGVSTRYDHQDLGPALYLFISGSAGCGKGTITPASLLTQEVDREIREASDMRMREYIKELQRWKSNKNKADALPPEKPPRLSLRAAADSTGSVLIRSLCHNPCVLLFDSEGDTLKVALRPDTIDASSALRKAWHHERIDQERVTDALYVATDRPHLAIVLTGTPEQILSLVQHVETGLTSRIGFIELPQQKEFRNPFIVVENRVQDIAISYQRSIRDLWAFVRDNSKYNGFRVVLTDAQQQRHFEHFKERYEDEIEAADAGTTLRAAINAVRIITVLSVVRQWFAKGTLDRTIVATDEDFDLGLLLAEFLRLGTNAVIQRLTANGRPATMPNARHLARKWYDNLPDVFTTKDALEHGNSVGIHRSTIFTLLRNEAYFERIKHGQYQKCQPTRNRGP